MDCFDSYPERGSFCKRVFIVDKNSVINGLQRIRALARELLHPNCILSSSLKARETEEGRTRWNTDECLDLEKIGS